MTRFIQHDHSHVDLKSWSINFKASFCILSGKFDRLDAHSRKVASSLG
ncbi:hypothetical protein [Candidatus Lokiarchaeum ossiferum]